MKTFLDKERVCDNYGLSFELHSHVSNICPQIEWAGRFYEIDHRADRPQSHSLDFCQVNGPQPPSERKIQNINIRYI